MSNSIKLGVAGLGTVGVGLLKILAAHGDLIAARCGRPIEVTAVSARERNRDRGVDISGYRWHDDPVALARDENVDIVVELIGGSDGIAKALAEAALGLGKSVVTANKALIAQHGIGLAALAEENDATLAFEAAVAGGIPIVKALKEGFSANRTGSLYGILNGTCNYILTKMEETGRPFDDVLREAQERGYAEADPEFDIDGVDTAHKLAILAAVAFGVQPSFERIFVEGIRNISADDIRLAGELGYRVKLLGIAEYNSAGVAQRVHPCLVRLDVPIAYVSGVYNAVVAENDFAEKQVFEGPGAGAGPTASAVLADIADIAAGRRSHAFSVPQAALDNPRHIAMEDHEGACYIRLRVIDEPGVIADISAILRDEAVSIDTLLQRGRAPGEAVNIVLITHEARESSIRRALAKMATLEAVCTEPSMIRIESL